MGKIRVLLADDHQAVLARVRVVLGEEFEIVGSVMNGNDAVTEVPGDRHLHARAERVAGGVVAAISSHTD